jgi:hypothetical protein
MNGNKFINSVSLVYQRNNLYSLPVFAFWLRPGKALTYLFLAGRILLRKNRRQVQETLVARAAALHPSAASSVCKDKKLQLHAASTPEISGDDFREAMPCSKLLT